MNEYDSGKMLEVLAAAEGYLPPKILPSGRAPAQYLLVREKAQERVFTQIGLWKAFKKLAAPVW